MKQIDIKRYQRDQCLSDESFVTHFEVITTDDSFEWSVPSDSTDATYMMNVITDIPFLLFHDRGIVLVDEDTIVSSKFTTRIVGR